MGQCCDHLCYWFDFLNPVDHKLASKFLPVKRKQSPSGCACLSTCNMHLPAFNMKKIWPGAPKKKKKKRKWKEKQSI